jgi:hypothetical protein
MATTSKRCVRDLQTLITCLKDREERCPYQYSSFRRWNQSRNAALPWSIKGRQVLYIDSRTGSPFGTKSAVHRRRWLDFWHTFSRSLRGACRSLLHTFNTFRLLITFLVYSCFRSTYVSELLMHISKCSPSFKKIDKQIGERHVLTMTALLIAKNKEEVEVYQPKGGKVHLRRLQ